MKLQINLCLQKTESPYYDYYLCFCYKHPLGWTARLSLPSYLLLIKIFSQRCYWLCKIHSKFGAKVRIEEEIFINFSDGKLSPPTSFRNQPQILIIFLPIYLLRFWLKNLKIAEFFTDLSFLLKYNFYGQNYSVPVWRCNS